LYLGRRVVNPWLIDLFTKLLPSFDSALDFVQQVVNLSPFKRLLNILFRLFVIKLVGEGLTDYLLYFGFFTPTLEHHFIIVAGSKSLDLQVDHEEHKSFKDKARQSFLRIIYYFHVISQLHK
jgi:hypothetical protein